jgi:hypothetical protein
MSNTISVTVLTELNDYYDDRARVLRGLQVSIGWLHMS